MYTLATVFAVALALGVDGVVGHRGCGGHEVMKRNVGGPIINNAAELRSLQSRSVARRQVTDEASAAQSTDPSTECVAYSYQPVMNIKSSFPTTWETATLVAGDDEAASLFATINSTVNSKLPNVKPKGTNAGDFSNVGYNASDPDCWWTWRQCTKPDSNIGVDEDHTTVPEPNTWGLSFDDGPNCSHNAFYDYLRDKGQKATMFYIGSNVMNWPLQAQRGLEDGHEISFAELYYTRKAIKEVVGVTPTCWRPPFGDVDNRIRLIAQGLNLTNYVWSDDSEDWRANAPGSTVTIEDVTANYQALVGKASNGSYASHGPIVLTHEINNSTMSEFISQYDSMKGAFKYIVPLACAFNITQPYVETNVSYPDFLTYTNQSTGDSNKNSSSSSSTSNSSNSANKSDSSTSAQSSTTGVSNNANSKSSAMPNIELNTLAIGFITSFAGLFALL